jgi:hypothetical protein
MNLKDELMTDRGQAVGFGRVKIPKIPVIEFDLDIPLFSFVVIERDEEHLRYIASCIHLHIDGYGDTIKNAILDMSGNIVFFLCDNFKDEGCREYFWENLYIQSKTNSSSSILWDKYHALQYLCAKNGISTDSDCSKLRERIVELEKKVEESNKKIAEKDATILALTNSYISEVVGYTVVEYDAPEKKDMLALQ